MADANGRGLLATLRDALKPGNDEAGILLRRSLSRASQGPVVATYVAPLRRGQPVCQSTPESPPAPMARPTLTARQLSYLLLRRPSDRTAEEQEPLAQVQQHDPIIA